MLKTILLFLILLVPSIHVRADDWDGVFLTSGFRSRHDAGAGKGKVDSKGRQVLDYNHSNTGGGLALRFHDDWSLVIGEYYNSLYQDTVYVGFGYQPYHYNTRFGNWSAGVVTVLATGYTKNDRIIVPLPAVSYTWGPVGCNLILIPSVVYSMQLTVKL